LEQLEELSREHLIRMIVELRRLNGRLQFKDAQLKPRTQDKIEKLSSRARRQVDNIDIPTCRDTYGVARFDRVRLPVLEQWLTEEARSM
jgi:hypothetical protein